MKITIILNMAKIIAMHSPKASVIAMHSSEASAHRALAQISRPPDGWLEIETVEDTEQPEWWIVAYPTEGSLAFEKWVIANTPKHES